MTIANKLNQLSNRVGFSLLLIYVVSQITIGWLLGHKMGAQLVPMQLAFTEQRFQQVVGDWGADELHRLQQHFFLDFIHPFWYGLFLAWALSKVLSPKHWKLVWLPIVAASCDLIENSIHASAVFGGSFLQMTQPAIAISSTFALTKWVLALGSLLIVVAVLLKRATSKRLG